MVIVFGNGHGDPISNPRQSISHGSNTFGKRMNLTILSLGMDKLFYLGMVTGLGEGKL